MQSFLLEFARSLKRKVVEVYGVLVSSQLTPKPEEGRMTDSVVHVSLIVI